MRTPRIRPIAAATLFAAAIATAGCGPYMLESTWRTQPVVIDGADTSPEWSAASFTFDTKKVTVGLMNDERYLYLRLATRDKSIQRRVVMGGLTVWLNGTGKKDKSMGVHFPLAMMSGGMDRQPPGQGNPPQVGQDGETPPNGGDGRGMGERGSGPDPGSLPQASPSMFSAIELTLPESVERTSIPMAEAEAMGVTARIGFSSGRMVYEMRIPISREGDSPVFASLNRGECLGIGLETGKVTVQTPSGGSSGGPGGGGMGGGGMSGGMTGMGRGGGMGGGMGGGGMRGGPGGGGGMGGQQQMDTGESLNLWIKAKIANPS